MEPMSSLSFSRFPSVVPLSLALALSGCGGGGGGGGSAQKGPFAAGAEVRLPP
jgi:hypothetical protein